MRRCTERPARRRPGSRRQRARPAHLRARRLHEDGGQGGVPPGRAGHGRLRRQRRWSAPSSTPDDIALFVPTRPTCASSKRPRRASASPWTRWPWCRPHRATPRAPRSPWPSPTPPTPAACEPGDNVLMSGFGAGMAWASAVVRWASTRRPGPGVVSAADVAGGSGRVVLVTGGSRGIGLACARRFQAARRPGGGHLPHARPRRPLGGEPGTADLLAGALRRPRPRPGRGGLRRGGGGARARSRCSSPTPGSPRTPCCCAWARTPGTRSSTPT